MMTEPDVTLTDYGLALECALFVVLLLRRKSTARRWWVVFFASASLASVLGGTVHGFFNDEAGAAYAVLWPATLIALGGAPLAGWFIGAELLKVRRGIAVCAWLLFAVYVVTLLFVTQAFWVAILHYLPPAVFLLAAFAITRDTRGLAGILLLFAAAGVQQSGIEFLLSVNALYHVVQSVAFLMLFLHAQRIGK